MTSQTIPAVELLPVAKLEIAWLRDRAFMTEKVDDADHFKRIANILEALSKPSEDAIEKVARALHDDRQEWLVPQERLSWKEASEGAKALSISQARVALEAANRLSLIPNEAITDAMLEAGEQMHWKLCGSMPSRIALKEIYRAMQEAQK